MDESLTGNGLLEEVRQLINEAKQRAAIKINAELTLLYWHVGRCIQTEILKEQRGEYRKQLIRNLSQQLTQTYEHGWGQGTYGTVFLSQSNFLI